MSWHDDLDCTFVNAQVILRVVPSLLSRWDSARVLKRRDAGAPGR
ncbi:MAG TPA: hypothetical protein VKK19_09575 [Candidatus Dormibacteraeota bacterium]|nr:hypothetical protein [Candidatus Dormibacteraeota bacterium]